MARSAPRYLFFDQEYGKTFYLFRSCFISFNNILQFSLYCSFLIYLLLSIFLVFSLSKGGPPSFSFIGVYCQNRESYWILHIYVVSFYLNNVFYYFIFEHFISWIVCHLNRLNLFLLLCYLCQLFNVFGYLLLLKLSRHYLILIVIAFIPVFNQKDFGFFLYYNMYNWIMVRQQPHILFLLIFCLILLLEMAAEFYQRSFNHPLICSFIFILLICKSNELPDRLLDNASFYIPGINHQSYIFILIYYCIVLANSLCSMLYILLKSFQTNKKNIIKSLEKW